MSSSFPTGTPPSGWIPSKTFTSANNPSRAAAPPPPPPRSRVGTGIRSTANGDSPASSRATSGPTSSSHRRKAVGSSRAGQEKSKSASASTSTSTRLAPTVGQSRHGARTQAQVGSSVVSHSQGPSSHMSGGTMETGDILTSAQTIGFAIDHPVWHDRPDEQAALARIAERSGLAASSVVSRSNGSNFEYEYAPASTSSYNGELPLLPSRYWTDIDNLSSDAELADPGNQLKAADNIAYFTGLMARLSYKRRLASLKLGGAPSVCVAPVTFTDEDAQRESWAAESCGYYTWTYLRCIAAADALNRKVAWDGGGP